MFLARIWYLLSIYLQHQENISVLVEILTKNANFYDYATLVQLLGLRFVVFQDMFSVLCSFALLKDKYTCY